MRKIAAFIDRDGVLIRDTHLITNIGQVEILNGVDDAISKIRELGFMTILVTNQTVVSRGLLPLDETLRLNKMILDRIEKLNPLAKFDDMFLCPHHPKATVEVYREDCQCRKPKPGMLLMAAKEHGIDLSKSFMVGDRISDVIAGNLAGCTTFQVTTGREADPIIESDLNFEQEMKIPNFLVENLLAVISHL